MFEAMDRGMESAMLMSHLNFFSAEMLKLKSMAKNDPVISM